jgi:hypothetical protein
MTSDVEIITENKKDVVLIKSTAISEVNWKNIVLVQQEGWASKKVEVETWITSDWKTEIISGVSEWDIIIIPEIKANTSTKETKMMMPGMGMWRGPR